MTPQPCEGCGAEVLTVRGYGRAWTVDAQEVLPFGRCGFCKGTGRVRDVPRTYVPGPAGRYTAESHPRGAAPCRWCEGSGLRGEQLARGMVLVNGAGHARPFFAHRVAGEAAYRQHVCYRAHSNGQSPIGGNGVLPPPVVATVASCTPCMR